MTTAHDYATFLTEAQLAHEEQLWRSVGIYRLYAAAVRRALSRLDAHSVLELGCGTGWVPTKLPAGVEYVGVDANPGCVALARTKTGRLFLCADVRSLSSPPADVVCGFAFLKHFGLHEWDAVTGRMLALGKLGAVFTMNVRETDSETLMADDRGMSPHRFVHTWVSAGRLEAVVAAAGQRVTETRPLRTGETMVWTEGIR